MSERGASGAGELPAATADRETARVEAFSDGVFAIAITLLILELKVPHHLFEGLGSALLSQWPAYLAFLASFFAIGVMWVNHHRLFTLIRRTSDGLLYYNGLLLLAVTIVPFPTAIVAEYLGTHDGRTAALIYNAHGLVIALAYTLLWRHAAAGGGRLIAPGLERAAADISRQYRFGPLLYLGGIALCFLSPVAAIVFDVALTLFFAVPPEALRRR